MSLNPREKKMLILTAALVAILAVYLGLIAPAHDRLATLQRVIPEKQAALVQLRQMADQYQTLQTRMNQFQGTLAASDRQDLPSLLEDLCKQLGLASKVTQMNQSLAPLNDRYQEVTVTLSLTAIALPDLVKFLTAVKTLPAPPATRTLDIQKNPSHPALLDTTCALTQPRRQNP